ncbi:non-canonical purine NTP pyrophosphatase [Candidatus Woesearchaeota archaeon]|nr:non-canonical purine NTP pyrophosphatase [Candidatus Woesearchaeota archaeon]
MKFLVAKNAIDNDQIIVEQLDIKTPEIQSMDVKEIAMFSAKWAADKTGKPVLKNDNSFLIEHLNGFPGPFVAYFDKCIGADGVMKLMKGVKNRKAKFVEATSYCEPGKEPIAETSELNGTIAEELQGKHGWFSDHFFIARGHDKTMGCYPDDERVKMWPQNCWKKIAKRILTN